MIIVLSQTLNIPYEATMVNQMFEGGLDLFHIRKYDLPDIEVIHYVSNLNDDYKDKLVLHSHHHLATELGIKRLHFNTESRVKKNWKQLIQQYIISTSVHSIEEFNQLENSWDYAFLSPVYSSISKVGYGENSTILSELSFRKNEEVDLIGLSGITFQNMSNVLEKGCDGVALMGSVWNQKDPASYVQACKKQEDIFKGSIVS